jgi:Tfp pilus assembly protein PilO
MRARIWELGGTLGAIALLAAGWFFFIGPQYDQTNRLNDQGSAAQARVATLQRRLVELRQQNVKLEQFRAQLLRDRQALPAASSLSDFLRELESAGASAGVSVRGLVVGSPTQIIGAATQVNALPITLIAVGTTAQLNTFLDQLQLVQPRAVLIKSVNAVPDGLSVSLAGTVSLTLSMRAFVGPAGGAPTAEPTASTS